MSEADEVDSGSAPALSVRGLWKTFGANQALVSVGLTVRAGEIHSLLGGNGSGKSTLIKILSGFHRPDAGEVLVAGRALTFGSASASHTAGCRFVHQDLGLVETETVLDNLLIGSGYPTWLGTVRSRAARLAAMEDLAVLGVDVDPAAYVSRLTPVAKTAVAVARSLRGYRHDGVRLLVLDEPTAALPEAEVERLHGIVRSVSLAGVAVLYVTHRLEEVFRLSDRITVLRDGRNLTTRTVADLTREDLVSLLVGEDFETAEAALVAPQVHDERPALKVRGLETPSVAQLSFDVRPGEIVGLAGITGSGYDSVLSAIFGRTPRLDGEVVVDGTPVPGMRADLAMSAGMGYMPADRKEHAAILALSARENLSIADLGAVWRWPTVRQGHEKKLARSWFARLNVRPGGATEQPISTFSGGNQQKILFARWLQRNPKVFCLDEPTQGVDIGAKAELHARIVATAQSGTAVVMCSSDVDELAALCHRVVVMRQGAIGAVLTGAEVTAAGISRECVRGRGVES